MKEKNNFKLSPVCVFRVYLDSQGPYLLNITGYGTFKTLALDNTTKWLMKLAELHDKLKKRCIVVCGLALPSLPTLSP